jgi:hypothetical protein
MLGPALAAGLLLALGQLQWDAGLRAEGRALQGSAGDLQLEPLLAFQSLSRDVALRAQYDPQVIMSSTASRGTFDALHRAMVSVALRFDPDTSITASQSVLAGSLDLSWLTLYPNIPPPTNVRRASAPPVPVLNGATSLTLGERFTHQLSASFTGGFAISGAEPRTWTIPLAASSTWTELRDTFTVGANGSYGRVSTGYTTGYVNASAAWRHAFSAASRRGFGAGVTDRRDPALGPLYETELSGGVALVGGNGPSQQHQVVPTGGLAVLREAPPGRGSLGARVALRYTPEIDPITGVYRQQGEVSASLDFRLDRDLLAYAQGGLRVTPHPLPSYPRALAQEALGLTYDVMRGVSVSAGVRVAQLVAATEWAGVVGTTLSQHGRF